MPPKKSTSGGPISGMEKSVFAAPKPPGQPKSKAPAPILKLSKGPSRSLTTNASKNNPPGKVQVAFAAAGAPSKGKCKYDTYLFLNM